MPISDPRAVRLGAPVIQSLDIPRVPWSELGPEFIEKWGRYDPKDPQPEHMEFLGPNGSGKTFLKQQIFIEMVRRRESAIIVIATKQQDKTITALQWPVVSTVREALKHEQCVFWPRTKATGVARKQFQAGRIQGLLDALWQPDANVIVDFDEFAYVESLTPDLKATCNMYLREGRSHGITVVAGKQRPQGVQRDMHSETRVTAGFRMKDGEDNERLATLLGNKRQLMPVVDSLDRGNHEFLFKHDQSDSLLISWVDKPRKPPKNRKGYRKR